MAALSPWVMAEVHRNSKARRSAFKLRDFMLSELGNDDDEPMPQLPPADPSGLWGRIGAALKALGGNDGDNGR